MALSFVDVPLATVSRRFVVAATVILVGAVLWGPAVPAAAAGGGDTIADAPDLPLGHQIASNWNQSQRTENGRYGVFWRVQLNAGDQLIIDWALTKSACPGANQGILVYSPSVTDGTVARASAAADHSTEGVRRHEFVWVAPSTGRWPLFFYGCNHTVYTVGAWVQRFTRTRVSAPSFVAHSRAFKATGTVSGTSSGNVAVAVSGPGPAKSLPLVALITSGGRFATRIRLPYVGTYTLRVNYYGDSSHRASKATVKIHVR
jgi:hypothetical protein